MLKGKTVLLGVTGSIAAYKIANLASALMKLHAEVHVIMTKNATNFINPITFETLTGNKCLVDTFDRNFEFSVEHVSIAKKADVVLVAPASANVIAKLAHGLADDMLTTTILACTCKKIISPAMNTRMFENPIVQDNSLRRMISSGYKCRCPTSIFAMALRVISHPASCSFAASASWVSPARRRSTRMFSPILFSIAEFIAPLLCTYFGAFP